MWTAWKNKNTGSDAGDDETYADDDATKQKYGLCVNDSKGVQGIVSNFFKILQVWSGLFLGIFLSRSLIRHQDVHVLNFMTTISTNLLSLIKVVS